MKNPDKSLKPYANFFFEAGILARTPRSGFRHLGGWDQSIAEHLFRTAYIGFALAHLEQEAGHQVNTGQVVENCLFHDFGEARALDLDYVSQRYSKSDELKAIQDAVAGLPFGPRIVAAFKETEEKSTPEGIIAKDADNLELICSMREISENGNKQADAWIPYAIQRLKTDSAKKLAEEILTTASDEWWFTEKSDPHWVNGGK